MTESNSELDCLLAKRTFSSLHRFCDLRYRRACFRVRKQLLHIIRSIGAACSVLGFFCHLNSRVVVDRGLLSNILKNNNIALVAYRIKILKFIF